MIKKFLLISALCLSNPIWAFTADDLRVQLQKPSNITGQFIQQRFIRSLEKPLQTSGQFVLQPKQGLSWHIQKPLDLRLRVSSDGIAQWDKTGKRWRSSNQSGQAAQVKLFMAVLSGDTQELGKHFDLQLSGNMQQWRLQLIPKTAVNKQIFQHIIISGGDLVDSVELSEKQGDRTYIRFERQKTNQILDAVAQEAWQ